MVDHQYSEWGTPTFLLLRLNESSQCLIILFIIGAAQAFARLMRLDTTNERNSLFLNVFFQSPVSFALSVYL